jgi:hypothetical protein
VNKLDKFVYERTLLYLQKNKDYGNSVDKTRLTLGNRADLVRIADKIHRVEQLALKQNEPKVAESIEDTILDLVVYMAIYSSGKDRTTMEQMTSPARLCDLIDELADIGQYPLENLYDLQQEIGKEILQDYTVEYITNYIKVLIGN